MSITKKRDTYITVIYHTMSDCTVSVSLGSVICLTDLSCHDLSCHASDYCISITKKSDRSIKVIYHAMSQSTVSVSLRRGIRISQ